MKRLFSKVVFAVGKAQYRWEDVCRPAYGATGPACEPRRGRDLLA